MRSVQQPPTAARLAASPSPWSDGWRPTAEQLAETMVLEGQPAPRQTVDVASMVDYVYPLSKTGRRVLEAFIANAQLYVDWFGDPESMFTQWFGEEIYGIPETSVRRGIKELVYKGYLQRVCKIKSTYRTARKKGRITAIYDLVVTVPFDGMIPNDEQMERILSDVRAGCEMPRFGARGQMISSMRVRLSVYLRQMRSRGELRHVWRMSNHVYFKHFGPIDAHERGAHLLKRLEDVRNIPCSADIGPPGDVSEPEEDILTHYYRRRSEIAASASPIPTFPAWHPLGKFDKRNLKPKRRDKRSKRERWEQMQRNFERARISREDSVEEFSEQQSWLAARR
jgi:hypothetical protein